MSIVALSSHQDTNPRGHHKLHVVLGLSTVVDTSAHPSHHVPSLIHTSLSLGRPPLESPIFPLHPLPGEFTNPPPPPPPASIPISTKKTPDFYLQSHPSSEPGPQIPSCSVTPPLVPQACPTQHLELKASSSLLGHPLSENGCIVYPVDPNLGPFLLPTSPQILISHQSTSWEISEI